MGLVAIVLLDHRQTPQFRMIDIIFSGLFSWDWNLAHIEIHLFSLYLSRDQSTQLRPSQTQSPSNQLRFTAEMHSKLLSIKSICCCLISFHWKFGDQLQIPKIEMKASNQSSRKTSRFFFAASREWNRDVLERRSLHIWLSRMKPFAETWVGAQMADLTLAHK